MKDYLIQCAALVDAQLESILPSPVGPAEQLFAAMRYSVFNGGKRIRPALCFAAAEAIADSDRNTAKVAAALEMVHAYSLIHDDLPAMDDDDLRRGKPTCHIQFDEATAILAGDALQCLAFEQLTQLSDLPAEVSLKLVTMLANYGGCNGMVTGQAIDLAATGNLLELEQLKQMHALKTGALIEASILMGALATHQADPEQLAALKEFAQAIGLAFQIQDDILDVESSTEQLGKQQGSDRSNGKSTYTSILGVEAARSQAADLYQHSMACLEPFGERAGSLRSIASFIVNRAY
ncbi:MAG: geranylgeranyl diphosphate synthase type II [Porticoccaceae bacterium]|jgi:geranylgeranyl diphosphate synthase type II|tara:strand:+ start:250 stop:1128 length:879 start_codon:yes stop_codon:yes gene_type:complete